VSRGWIAEQQEASMHCNILVLLAATALLLSLQIALADGDGATMGLVGGAVAGVGVGDPVGAVVGGAAGGVTTGSHRETVVAQPVVPSRRWLEFEGGVISSL
jgi:hypothetical protein